MVVTKLNGHKCANARVIIDAGEIRLYSYNTLIICADHDVNGNLRVICTGLYSKETRKHITWFLRDYFPNLSYNMIRDMNKNVPVLM